MSTPSWDSALHDVRSSLFAMRPEGIEAAESQLRELRDVRPDDDVLPQLRELRAAAVNAAQLWRVFVPESDALLYSPAGELQAVARPDGISVTA